ncbi:hypothetical protein HII31_04297 [Pseudocercospora fuligena]|uniref:NmrA-like domain-containing protein n=1 Tax=Pseudocercospora fuligena TaxID=685502 RepID=A0A8H6VN44_9PEZI|nr:hypothetical protein HII31_04297 [Pseudocercospora fuligena]
MQIKHVAVAGPNGTLGPSIIPNLLKEGFQVTALSRNIEKTRAAFPGVDAKEADYSSIDGLAAVLKTVRPDAVVCLLNRHAYQEQANLIDASIVAGVPHLIPSSFGVNTTDPEVRWLPPILEKVRMENYVRRKAEESNGKFTYTMINTGMFLDWAMKMQVLVNLKNDGQPSRIFNSGDVKASGTVLDDVGLAVAHALQKRDQLINRTCSIHSTSFSQNQLLAYAQELAPGRKFETVTIDTAEMQRQAQEKYDQGDSSPMTLRPFLMHATFGSGLSLFQKVDNEILDIPIWSKEKVMALVKEAME